MTENTQKEQFSIAYVRALAAATGVKVTKEEVDDDSVDITLLVSGGASSKMDVQLKCSGVVKKTATDFPFRLKLKNYNDLRRKTMAPRILVVLEVPEAVENWVDEMDDHMILRHRAYWVHLLGAEEIDNGDADTKVGIRIPLDQSFSCETLKKMMAKIEASGVL